MKWFRLYDEITEDPKMIQLTDQEFRVWIYLLCYMNKQTKRGFSSNYLPTILLLSGATKQRLNSINRALDKLESLDMIKRNDHSLQIVNWDTRQYKTDDVNERVKRYRNVTRNVTVTPPDTDTEQNKKDNTEVLSKKTMKRKTRISEDWRLPQEWGEWAEGQGLTGEEILKEAEKFRDRQISQGAAYLDWQATWRNWIRNHIEWSSKNGIHTKIK
jgi:hypothetical protein